MAMTRFRGALGYAELGRSGLGNKLFPHVRCLLWCEREGVRMLPSRFFQLPIGPMLRGERDLRLYTDLFRRPSLVGLAARFAAPKLLRVVSETEDQRFQQSVHAGVLYRFRGLGAYFKTLNGHHVLVGKRLRAVVGARWLDHADSAPAPMIGIHVRLGDFSGNILHPVEWYLDALRLVRQVAGWTVPAQVFSDGRPHELAPLLAEEGTSLVNGPNAVADLFHLARSRFLIGTGSSTFGAWAAFLGQMPALTRPGNPFSWWNLINQQGLHIGEVDVSGPAPDALVRDVRSALPRL